MNWPAIFILILTNVPALFNKALAEDTSSNCPIGKQFNIEAQLTCPENKDHFHCVPNLSNYNDVIRTCKMPKWFAKGTFSVYSLQYKKITSVPCEIGRYQDYSYKSNNISTFKCSKEKSFCTKEGQVTLFHDSPSENNLCYCKDDYTFLKNPNNGTYCNPDVENCSCILERTGQKSEVTIEGHFPKKETEKAQVIQTDKKEESTENLGYTSHRTNMIMIAVLLCTTLTYLLVAIFISLECKINYEAEKEIEKTQSI